MGLRTATWCCVLLGLCALPGCYYPVREKIDLAVCDIAKKPWDVQPPVDAPPPTMPPADSTITPTAYRANETAQAQEPAARKSDPFKDLQKYRQATLQVPPDFLLQGPPPELDLGPLTPENAPRRQAILRNEYPPLRPPGPDPDGMPGPFGHPLTLEELQRIAMASSPLIKQAVAAVETARGNAYQAGLLPNPILGFEVDTYGTTGGAGYVGGFMEQRVITGGKLRLSRAVAAMDLRNAEVALRKAQMDLVTKVRTFYYQLLVAKENMRINRILVAFTNAVYQLQVGQVTRKVEVVAGYEPSYLRALAMQARTNLVTARNSYFKAWKQLAATLGLPGMPLTQIEGRADMPIPVFDFRKVMTHVLTNNTDVVKAENDLQQARYALMLAQVTPYPDVYTRFLLQKDYTGPPNAIAPSLAVSMPIPILNRNQGGIAAAQATVVQMANEPARIRYDLYGRLSDAFNRYQSARVNLEIYRARILPDMVRVYNSIYRRYQQEMVTPVQPAAPGGIPLPQPFPFPRPELNDVVVAEQFLTSFVAAYIDNLGAMWQAVVDVTDFIQTNNMFRMGQEVLPTQEIPPIPDLETQLKPLLRTQPCSPLPDPRLRGGDGSWPEAIPHRNNYPMPPADDSQARRPIAPPALAAINPASPPQRSAPPPNLPAKPALPARIDPRLYEPPPPVRSATAAVPTR